MGDNTITVEVTAEDGATQKTYTLTVRRQSNNADLSGLTLSSGTLTPAFDKNTTSYTVTVPHEVDSVTVTPIAAHGKATVTVNGQPVASGTASGPINLNVGGNTLTVEVTAEDGTTQKTYTVTVRRQSNNADLSGLTLSSGTLTPTFDKETTSYTVTVPHEVDSVTVTPIAAHGKATVTVNGQPVASGVASGPINLNVGDNTLTVEVTAEDGAFTKTYTIMVTRAANNSTGGGGGSTTASTPNLPPGRVISSVLRKRLIYELERV